MGSDPRLDDLMDIWEERRQRGESVPPRELCADCPELEGEVSRRIGIILTGERALEAEPTGVLTVALAGISSPVLTAGSTVGFTYEILDERGRGGMGVVYRVSVAVRKRAIIAARSEPPLRLPADLLKT